jgi:hypothetical protein
MFASKNTVDKEGRGVCAGGGEDKAFFGKTGLILKRRSIQDY